jgi:hypothetical protein
MFRLCANNDASSINLPHKLQGSWFSRAKIILLLSDDMQQNDKVCVDQSPKYVLDVYQSSTYDIAAAEHDVGRYW